MADSSRQSTTPSRRTWVRLCLWLWNRQGFLWGTVFIGVALNLFASWLITPSGAVFSQTPLGKILGYPLLLALGGLGLLGLTVGLWLVNRLHSTPSSQRVSTRPLTEADRHAVVHLLHQEYGKRLAQSLQGVVMMVLGLHERTDAIRSSAELVFRRTDIVHEAPLPPGTSITQVYDNSGHGLLLLGASGAGKTTLLLDLACELLVRAESNSAHPIAVILNLSSWASKKPPLTLWLVDQLRMVYGIPSRLSQMLLEQDQWLLLLDGLDEVEASARSECIEAINLYREEHAVSLVVCSRSHEYLTQPVQLVLSSAIEIQPLEEREVMKYLQHLGKSVAAVRAALQTNPILKHLLTTPLMLGVVILAFRGMKVKDIPKLGSIEEQRQQIFERYIQRMLERPVAKSKVTPQQSRCWLRWLARHMTHEHLTEFYLEDLDPSWIPTVQTQILYDKLYILLSAPSLVIYYGLPIGLVVGLFIGLLGLAVGLFIALLGELALALIIWPYSESHLGLRQMPIQDNLKWPWKNIDKEMLTSLAFGLLTGLFLGLLAGLLVYAGPFELVRKLCAGLLSGLFVVVLFVFAAAPERQRIDKEMYVHPNQRIRVSGWNALRSGLFFGLLGGLLGGLFITLLQGLFVGLASAPIYGLLTGLAVGANYGGGAYCQHYLLRFFLWRSGRIPWHYVRFLEEASERVLLQYVGGGYRFIHPLFQDYFASLGTGTHTGTELSLSSQQP